MKTIILAFITTLCVQLSLAQETSLDIENFTFLDETEWEGELMYRNYSDFKKVTIPATLAVETRKKGLFIRFEYPAEPKANFKKLFKFDAEAQTFGGDTISEITKVAEDHWKIKTVSKGNDNDMPAEFRETYEVSKDKMVITKEVQLEGKSDSFVRNQYTFIPKN